MPLTTSQVILYRLKHFSKQVNDERVGATIDIERRRGEYQRKGYHRTIILRQKKYEKSRR